MKRYGYIIKEVVEPGILEASFDYVLRGTMRKTSRSGRYLINHKDEVIARLREEISTGTFKLGSYHEDTIKEGEKWRTIQCIPLVKRIAVNAIMTVVERKLHPTFIADTAASMQGRGCLYLFNRIRKVIREDPAMRWFYQDDISKFYPSISQEVMMQVARWKFKDPLLLNYLGQCIHMLDQGISIGLRSSQFLANLLLSIYIDHHIKDDMAYRSYWRYCDDKLLGAHTPAQLTPGIQFICHEVEKARMKVKPNSQVFCIDYRPLDILGYRLYANGKIEIRKRIKKRFARRWKRVRSMRRRTELIGSFYGRCKHAHAGHLFKTITGINMKDFSELGLRYVSANGKKLFDCETIHLNDLQNRQVIVRDYETEVDTRQGKGRYVVLIDIDGQQRKFFTNSIELKQLLDKAREINEIPFRATIRRKPIGENRYMYTFA